MEEKMGTSETIHNDSEKEDIKAFLEMKKFHGKKLQITKSKSSAMYNNCSKEFKTLFNHKSTPIDTNTSCSCAVASHIWQGTPTPCMKHKCFRTSAPTLDGDDSPQSSQSIQG